MAFLWTPWPNIRRLFWATFMACSMMAMLVGCHAGYTFPKISWQTQWPHHPWPDSFATCLERQLTLDPIETSSSKEKGESQEVGLRLRDWQRYLIERTQEHEEQEFRHIVLPGEGPGAVVQFTAQVSYPRGETQRLTLGDLRTQTSGTSTLIQLVGTLPPLPVGTIVDIFKEMHYPSIQAAPPVVLSHRFPIHRLQCSWPSDGSGAMLGKVVADKSAHMVEPTLQDSQDPASRWLLRMYDIPPQFTPSASPWQQGIADRKTSHLQLRWSPKLDKPLSEDKAWLQLAQHFAAERAIRPARGRSAFKDNLALLQQLRDKLPLCRQQGQLGFDLAEKSLKQPIDGQKPCSERAAAYWALKALGGLSDQVALALLQRPDGSPVESHFPSLGAFSGIVLAVRPSEDAPWQWLDPLCAECPLGILPFHRAEHQALLIHPQGISWQSLGRLFDQNRFEQHVQGTLTLTGTMDWSGPWRVSGSIVPWLRQMPQGWPSITAEGALHLSQVGAWPALAASSMTVTDIQDNDVEGYWQAQVAAREKLANPILSNQPLQLRQATLWGEAVQDSWLPKGQGPHLLVGPRTLQSELSLRLPPGLDRMVLPQPIQINHPDLYYQASWQVDSKLRFLSARRILILRSAFITSEHWSESVGPMLHQIQQYEQTPIDLLVK